MRGARYRATPAFKQFREGSACCGRKATVRVVAAAAGISPAAVTRIEKGTLTASEETAARLASAVGATTVGQVFERVS